MHNADKVVGKILLALEEEEVADSTVIIYLADQQREQAKPQIEWFP